MKNKFWTLDNLTMGFTFLLVNITSVIVVTQIMGLNLPLAFLVTGINTILFHVLTKHKLASVVGISGLYIGSILLITQKYSVQYALGGVVMSGIMYLVFAFCMFKWQDKIFKFIPKWLLSFSIVLIGLSLIPIANNLIKTNLLVAMVSLATMFLIEFKGGGKLRLFSMPIAILVSTLVAKFTTGLIPVAAQTLAFTLPKFNIESFFTISLITLAVVFECMGDSQNTGDIMEIDLFKEVGMGRVLLGIGLSTLLNGFLGAAPTTTYSEQNSAVMLTKYKNTFAQIFTSVFFVLLAFITPITSLILMIPKEAFSGCLLYLFASIVINAIKQIGNSGIDLNTNKKAFMIMSVMLGLFFVSFTIYGVSISSIAISMFVGIFLNVLIKDEVSNG